MAVHRDGFWVWEEYAVTLVCLCAWRVRECLVWLLEETLRDLWLDNLWALSQGQAPPPTHLSRTEQTLPSFCNVILFATWGTSSPPPAELTEALNFGCNDFWTVCTLNSCMITDWLRSLAHIPCRQDNVNILLKACAWMKRSPAFSSWGPAEHIHKCNCQVSFTLMCFFFFKCIYKVWPCAKEDTVVTLLKMLESCYGLEHVDSDGSPVLAKHPCKMILCCWPSV